MGGGGGGGWEGNDLVSIICVSCRTNFLSIKCFPLGTRRIF